MIPCPKGFSFAALAAGFKYQDKLDLGLALSETPAQVAGVFTTNLYKAAPVVQCMEIVEAGRPVRAVVANSGQANAVTGEEGYRNCRLTREMVAREFGLETEEVMPASTGVIGQQLKMELWRDSVPGLAGMVGTSTPMEFARAIMTTDTFPKPAWATVPTEGGEVRVLGMAKGSGMIHPNMATLLCFIFTDARVEGAAWQEMIRGAADATFNRLTVDGDTSTNDSLIALANGASGIELPEMELADAVFEVCSALSYMIVEDAEGGTKVIRILVAGAKSDAEAKLAAQAVGTSPLVKTAFYGKDANWGRIVAALGRSGASFDPDKVGLDIGGVRVFDKGNPAKGDLDGLLAPIMRRNDITLEISLGDGPGTFDLLASDLSHEYISINADYRS